MTLRDEIRLTVPEMPSGSDARITLQHRDIAADGCCH